MTSKPFSTVTSRQPNRLPWSRERLVQTRALALGNVIDQSSQHTYGSALNSYLHFTQIHNLPIDPTEDTLSFFIVYMSHHIQPRSVKSYLSGIVSNLEPYFPHVRTIRHSQIVSRTLRGCIRMRSNPQTRKAALTTGDIKLALQRFPISKSYDNNLFIALLCTGFFGLLRLGSLTFPDDTKLRDWKKIIRRSSVILKTDSYEFLLNTEKNDKYFEGNKIIIKTNRLNIHINPVPIFKQYLSARDNNFPLHSPLWLTSAGLVPTRNFFISKMRLIFDKNLAGQSMRAGGATFLAEHNIPSHLIQSAGRWSSDSFQRYIRKHPALMQALILSTAS